MTILQLSLLLFLSASLPSAAGLNLQSPESQLDGIKAQTNLGDGDRPANVLFIIIDDASVRSVGASGGEFAQTPNIDALAARGVVVENAYHMGAFSGAICTVSRAMILTGRTVWSITPGKSGYGGTANLQTDDVLMPELFRSRGYQTFGTGKWHNGNTALMRCFERAEAIAGGMLPYNAKDHGGAKNPAIDLGHRNPKVRRFDAEQNKLVSYQAQGWSTDVYFDCAEKFLQEQRDDDKPFFMYLSTSAPHDPRHVAAEYLKPFVDADIPLHRNHLEVHPFDSGDMKVRDEMVYPAPHDAEQVQREFAIYLAMVAHIDARIGRLLALLEKQGELENTLIVFTSDHGLSMGEKGLMGKQNLYEASWRVPMIVSGPTVPQAKRVQGFAYLHGIYPTLCDLLGMPTPEHAKEFSFAKMLQENSAGQEQVVGVYTPNASSKRGVRSIRQGRWKLIHYLHNRKLQLFDLQSDPWELENLADDSAHAETVKKLAASLTTWMENNNDPQL